jgi:hypothetical protein
VRRFQIVLGHLCYFLRLKNSHFARTALNNSIELALEGKKSWAQDLVKAAQGLPYPCPIFILNAATTVEYVTECSKMDSKLLQEWLQEEINSSEKLYLLHGHVEPQKDGGPVQITSIMRHYLSMVRVQKHREVITSLLLSIHLLAVEILRYVDHAYAPVPQAERLCRICKKADVETPEHALISCDALDALNHLRSTFLTKLFLDAPFLQLRMAELTNTEFVKAMIYYRPTIALVAKYVYDVLVLFYLLPVFRLKDALVVVPRVFGH